MRAVVVEEVGGPEQLVVRELPDPVAQNGQQLVEVGAAGVNYADVLIRGGRYPQPPALPFVPGSEVAGTTGDGRRVLGLVRQTGGGYAERVVVDDDWLVDLPPDSTFSEGAAFPLAFLTAWIPLVHQARVRPGSSVLVTAAAGGVGSAAIQVARALGAEVVAAVGSPDKHELPRSLGASQVVGYDDIETIDPVDAVLDMVGGPLYATTLKRVKPLGTTIAVGFAGGSWEPIDPALLVGRNVAATGFFLGRLLQLQPALVRQALDDLVRLWAAGELRPVVGASFPLADAPEAHRLVEDRRSTGKVVLVP